MNYVASSFESFALGVCTGLLYMFIQAATARLIGLADEKFSSRTPQQIYRSLLILRLAVSAMFVIAISKLCIVSTAWLITGFITCIALRAIQTILRTSWN